MSKRIFFSLLVLVLLGTSLLVACTTTTTTPNPVTTSGSTTQTIVNPASTTTSVVTTSTASQTNWWDKFGTPQYGGTIITSITSVMANFDVQIYPGGDSEWWLETLWSRPDWTTDRNEWNFQSSFVPQKYTPGVLAESWEQPDGQTIIVHIRKGVYWQDKAPVNGRELTAYDVEAHYNRLMGKGGGNTEPAAMYLGTTSNWESVTATDNYTVVFKLKEASSVAISALMDPTTVNMIEAPEWVALGSITTTETTTTTTTTTTETTAASSSGGSGAPPPPAAPAAKGALGDWKQVVGTGPWMLTDFVAGSVYTYTRNPNYWGYDERYPQNQLPYADQCKIIQITDSSTSTAALRTGKIDMLFGLNWQTTNTLLKNNSELEQATTPGSSYGVTFRLDNAPFTDIRVRKALNMSLDRKTIANSLYHGAVDGTPVGIVSSSLSEYCYQYEDWPQSLKDEYSYSTTAAKQLLTDAGYPDGFKTNVVLSTTDDLELYQAIKAYFMDIGVDMEIKTVDLLVLESFKRDSKHDQMVGASGSGAGTPTRTIEQYYSKGPDNGSTKVNDSAYDAIRDTFWSTNDPDKAAQAMREADKYIIENHWLVTVCPTVSYNLWQPYIKGYSGENGLFLSSWGGGYFRARLFVDQKLKTSMGR